MDAIDGLGNSMHIANSMEISVFSSAFQDVETCNEM